MPKLEELQLLLASPEPCFYWDNEDQEHVSSFFMLTPLPVLQRLFLRVCKALSLSLSLAQTEL